jgi:hypothetical protein
MLRCLQSNQTVLCSRKNTDSHVDTTVPADVALADPAANTWAISPALDMYKVKHETKAK